MFDISAFLRRHRGIRFIGDVHGEYAPFRALVDQALAEDYGIALAGDIADRGPRIPEAMDLAVDLVETGKAVMVASNHDWKFARHERGSPVKIAHGLAETLAQLDAHPDGARIRGRFAALAESAPIFLRLGSHILAHGAMAPGMLWMQPFAIGNSRMRKAHGGVVDLALYGQTDGTVGDDGFPNRSFDWIDWIPAGRTAVVGHTVIGEDIDRRVGDQGGVAWHIDTGAGKGGRLSCLDVPIEEIGVETTLEPRATDDTGAPLLTILCGPSGSGKSTWASANFDADIILGRDDYREALCGDFRDQSRNRVVMSRLYQAAADRLCRGLPVVLDATHIKRPDRMASYSLLPEDAPVRLVVIDRPLEEKMADGGWRLENLDQDGKTLVERHHATFQSNVKDILAADGRPNVEIVDLRRT